MRRANLNLIIAAIIGGGIWLGAGVATAQDAVPLAPTTAPAPAPAPVTTPVIAPEPYYSRSSSVRIGIQARFDAVNTLRAVDWLGLNVPYSFVPIVTPGVRFLDDRLYLGLGLGFAGGSTENPGANGQETSRSVFSFSPLALYDILSDKIAALSVGGWLNLSSLSDTEVCPRNGSCYDVNNDAFGWGLNFAAGVRGKLSAALGVGAEFGWGFLSVSSNNNDTFFHGVFGNIFLEGSIGV